jgi:hypothetical protein
VSIHNKEASLKNLKIRLIKAYFFAIDAPQVLPTYIELALDRDVLLVVHMELHLYGGLQVTKMTLLTN